MNRTANSSGVFACVSSAQGGGALKCRVPEVSVEHDQRELDASCRLRSIERRVSVSRALNGHSVFDDYSLIIARNKVALVEIINNIVNVDSYIFDADARL